MLVQQPLCLCVSECTSTDNNKVLAATTAMLCRLKPCSHNYLMSKCQSLLDGLRPKEKLLLLEILFSGRVRPGNPTFQPDGGIAS